MRYLLWLNKCSKAVRDGYCTANVPHSDFALCRMMPPLLQMESI